MALYFGELLLRGSLLCLLTALVLVTLHRVAAAYRHLLCTLALCGLLLLPLLHQTLPPLPLLPASTATEVLPSGQIPQTTDHAPPLQAEASPKDRPISPTSPVFAQVSTRPLSLPPLLILWILVTLLLLARLTRALLHLRTLAQQSEPVILPSIPVREGVVVLASDRISTPLTWGVRHPILLLPVALLSADPVVLASAVRHEEAHIDRRDWLWHLLAEIVCALSWFQPGAWWLRSRMRQESERACDDRVLLSGVAGPDYAAHLLEIIRTVRSEEVAPALGQRRGMEDRMKHILNASARRQARPQWLAASASLTLVLLSVIAVRVSAKQTSTAGAATTVGAPPQTTPGGAAMDSSFAIENVIWGDAVDELEPGFLRTTDTPNPFRIPMNTQVDYRVLVRNRSDRERLIQVRLGNVDPWITSPYLIPNSDLSEATRTTTLPDRFRAIDVNRLYLWPPAYDVRLAPGEAVIIPGETGLYIGNAGKERFPRVERSQPGKHWIIQPITVHILTGEEEAQSERARKTPYSTKIEVTVIGRDGKSRNVSIPQAGARRDGTQLLAKMPLDIETRSEKAARSTGIVSWGKTDKGLQCGIRLLNPKSTIRLGDTLEAELLWRNVGTTQLQIPHPFPFDLAPQVRDTRGNSIPITFGARPLILLPLYDFAPGAQHSLGTIRITLVAAGTPAPQNFEAPGHLTLKMGAYTLSAYGGASAPDGGNPESGNVSFRVE